jgi:hypothetical protein
MSGKTATILKLSASEEIESLGSQDGAAKESTDLIRVGGFKCMTDK